MPIHTIQQTPKKFTKNEIRKQEEDHRKLITPLKKGKRYFIAKQKLNLSRDVNKDPTKKFEFAEKEKKLNDITFQ